MLENNPLVSICVITYQHAKYIEECLDSILMQKTNFSYEIVIGEDESTDGTREICERYAEKYPNKIKLFLRQRKDLIYVRGKPTGRYNFMETITAAKGKYIALCEGDDYWIDEHKLQKQIDFLESNSAYAICCHNALIDDERKGKKKYFRKSGQAKDTYNIHDIFDGWFIPTCSIVFRNIADFCFPEWYTKIMGADIALICILAQYGKIKFFDEYLSSYRLNYGGISNSFNVNYKLELTVSLIEMYRYVDEYYDYKYKEEINVSIENILFNHSARLLLLRPKGVIEHTIKKIRKEFSPYIIY